MQHPQYQEDVVALMLERDHRRFQHEVLAFFDRPECGPAANRPRPEPPP